MIRQDYANPIKSYELTLTGRALRLTARLLVAAILTIILGIQLP